MLSSVDQAVFGALRDETALEVSDGTKNMEHEFSGGGCRIDPLLKADQINLISLEERIDTTSAAGEFVFHVFGAIAHFERRLISERTKDGLINARKHGRTPGRPPLQPETISALQDLVNAGKSVAQAAKHLGIGRSTAYKVIRNTTP